MTKLLSAALAAASLSTAAQAAVTPQDQAWVARMNTAVDAALSASTEALTKLGVVYVPVSVDADGRLAVAAPVQSCGCPDLDQAAVDALRAMGRAPRPPADLIGKRILVRAVFRAETDEHGDLADPTHRRCR